MLQVQLTRAVSSMFWYFVLIDALHQCSLGCDPSNKFLMQVPYRYDCLETTYFLEGGQRTSASITSSSWHFADDDNFKLHVFALSESPPRFVKEGKNASASESEMLFQRGQFLITIRKSQKVSCSELLSKEQLDAKTFIVSVLPSDFSSVLLYNSEKEKVDRGFFGNIPRSLDDLRSFQLKSPDDLTLIATRTDSKENKRYEFSLVKGRWLPASFSWTIRDPTAKDGPRHFEQSFKLDQSSSNILRYHCKEKVEHSSGQSSESESLKEFRDLDYSQPSVVELTKAVPNGQRVSLMDEQQIKAVWKDGKVVRVFDEGTVDDLGSSTFRVAQSKSWLPSVGWVFLAVVFAGTYWIFWSRARSNTK